MDPFMSPFLVTSLLSKDLTTSPPALLFLMIVQSLLILDVPLQQMAILMISNHHLTLLLKTLALLVAFLPVSQVAAGISYVN